jgi:hypothetical protein
VIPTHPHLIQDHELRLITWALGTPSTRGNAEPAGGEPLYRPQSLLVSNRRSREQPIRPNPERFFALWPE